MTILVVGLLLSSVLLVTVCFWPLVADMVRGRFDLFNPRNFFLAYLALQLGIYPAYVILGRGSFRFLDPDDKRDASWMILALLLSTLGVLAFHFCYIWASRTNFFSQMQQRRRLRQERVAFLMALFVPFVAFCSYSVYFSRNGLGGYADSFVEVRYAGTGASGFMFYFATTLVSILAALAFLAGLGASRRKTWWTLAGVLFLCSMATAALSGYRAALAPILLMMGACSHYYIKRFRLGTALIFVTGLFATMTIYGIFRGQFEARITGIDADRYGRIGMADALLVRSPGIELVAITMRGINEGEKYTYFGPAIWEAATIIIPRPWWDGKPVPQSMVYGEKFMSYYLFLRDGVLGTNTGGQSMTVIGYLYWQCGAPAVVGGLALLGIFFGWFYRYFISRKEDLLTAFAFIVMSSSMAKFAEAPQDTLNSMLIGSLFVFPFAAFCAGPLGPIATPTMERVTPSMRLSARRSM